MQCNKRRTRDEPIFTGPNGQMLSCWFAAAIVAVQCFFKRSAAFHKLCEREVLIHVHAAGILDCWLTGMVARSRRASWHVRRIRRRTSAAARQSVSSESRYRLLVLPAPKAARPMLRLRRRLAMYELSTLMNSRFPTFRLHHSGLSITKTRRLRKAKRLRGGGDVVVAEAVAVAEAVGAAEAAEGVAADRLLTLRSGHKFKSAAGVYH
jgi:hypothetical protein